jgi:hypothetical protein
VEDRHLVQTGSALEEAQDRADGLAPARRVGRKDEVFLGLAPAPR